MSIKKSLLADKGVYKVTFSLPVKATDGKSSVVLLGDFNQWDPNKAKVMKAGKTEYSASVDLKPGTYEFRYLINDNIWENDYSADNYIASPFPGINNSVIHLPGIEKQSAKKVSVPKTGVDKSKASSTAKAAKVVAKTPKATAKAAKAPLKSAKTGTSSAVKAAATKTVATSATVVKSKAPKKTKIGKK